MEPLLAFHVTIERLELARWREGLAEFAAWYQSQGSAAPEAIFVDYTVRARPR